MKHSIFSGLMGLVVIVCGCDIQQSPPTYTVNDPSDANTTWKSDKPLTIDEAMSTGKCPIPLPKEAKNIQYVDFYAGFGGFSRYVRFQAPTNACQDHAKEIIMGYNSWQTQETRRVGLDPKPLDRQYGESLAASARRGEPVSQAAWFDTDNILNGIVWGESRSHTPVVVIDIDRAIFYYHISD